MRRALAWALLLGFAHCDTASAAIAGLQRVASGLSSPIFATYAPGDRSRLFIAERGGAIRILNLETGTLEATPFLTMSGISTTGEGGFLGLAFHPDYFNVGTPGYGKLYVDVTTNNTTFSHIREFTVSAGDPNVADAGSQREILNFSQPQTNHDGGWIGFSPKDNYLYIATGDGGGGNDTDSGHTAGTGNAQDITDNRLGKMLRLDVNGDDFPADDQRNYAIPPTNPFVGLTGDDEIWAFGLRNPFRDSFDRLTGDLWIGDVGQGTREEIDFQPADSSGGENYGWRLREGTIATPSSGGGAPPPGNVEPVYDYGHVSGSFGGTVVSGGYIYRGPDPSLQGQYFFLDSRNSASAADDNYWMFDPANPYGSVQNINSSLTASIGNHQFPVSFGEDAIGNLYIAYIDSGEVYRIATNELLPGDYNADGDVDDADYTAWMTNFGATAGVALAADGNGDGVVNAADYTVWRNNFGSSVHNLGAGSGSVSVPEPAACAAIGSNAWASFSQPTAARQSIIR